MSKLDNEINDLLNHVKKEQEKHADLVKESKFNSKWLTNSRYTMNNGTSLMLQTINEDAVVEVYAELLMVEKYKNKACEELGLEKVCVEHNESTFEDWKHDLNKRLTNIKLKKQSEILKKAEASLHSILSETQKREMKFAEILKDLSSL